MVALKIVSAWLALTLTQPAPPELVMPTDALVAVPSDDASLDDEAGLELGTDDLPDNSDALSTDVDRWLLHDVLADHGVAQSQDWHETLAAQGRQSTGGGWLERLHSAQTEQLLRGEPSQHRTIDLHAFNFDIPLANHPLVDLYIDYFTGRGRWFFAKWLARSGELIPLMRPILARRGVPEDLVYLAMIESGFSPRAFSTASAAGYWQFMPSTGRLFGLSQTLFVDERRDFIRSTEAAAAYLAALHRSLGDWHLAWASYNAGEGRIRRAMAKTHTTSFWQLVEYKDVLAKETLHYVPKIIAAAIVAKDAARYGFVVPNVAPLTFDSVDVTGALDLRNLARQMHIDPTILRDLNPALVFGVTPPAKISHVRVPRGSAAAARVALARLPPAKRLTQVAYRVKRGDTLISIARRMNSTVETLRQVNQLKSGVIRPGQQLIVPGFRLAEGPSSLLAASKKNMPVVARADRRVAKTKARSPQALRAPKRMMTAQAKDKYPRTRHVVRAGDTLWGIAQRYKVSLQAIRGHTRRHSDRLAVGEVLDIF